MLQRESSLEPLFWISVESILDETNALVYLAEEAVGFYLLLVPHSLLWVSVRALQKRRAYASLVRGFFHTSHPHLWNSRKDRPCLPLEVKRRWRTYCTGMPVRLGLDVSYLSDAFPSMLSVSQTGPQAGNTTHMHN